MALAAGSRLGPYVITAPIGPGRMGEVYKATDTRLERTVAIKVLPAHVASDPERKSRFEREAKTVAALSHPHICPVFDVGCERPRLERGAGGEHAAGVPPSEGERGWGPASSEDVTIDFLVMEYLEGETLADRLSKGALPLDQALRYAIEIADALCCGWRWVRLARELTVFGHTLGTPLWRADVNSEGETRRIRRVVVGWTIASTPGSA